MRTTRPESSPVCPAPGQRHLLLFGCIALAVLGLKCRLLLDVGMDDMAQYEAWGRLVTERGLVSAYCGIYFPLQWQLFGATWVLAQDTGTPFFVLSKLTNLLFDLGNFALIWLLLRRSGCSPWYALLYWAHPWFVVVFSLGYVDFQFAFFLLLAIYLAAVRSEARAPVRYHLLVGTPIALAFLMKPQVQVIVLALGIRALFEAWRQRRLHSFAVLLPSAVLFAGYSAYFAQQGTAFLHLARSYLDISQVMPCLTAHMPNLWYPVAFALKEPADPIYAVTDTIQLTPWGLQARTLAAAISVGLVALFVWLQVRQGPSAGDPGRRLGEMFAFTTMVLPFTMTSAHENHLFLGSIFLLVHLARTRDRALLAIWHGMVLLQFVNIYILYGRGAFAWRLREGYSDGLRTGLAVADSLLFAWFLYAMFAPLLRRQPEPSHA